MHDPVRRLHRELVEILLVALDPTDPLGLESAVSVVAEEPPARAKRVLVGGWWRVGRWEVGLGTARSVSFLCAPLLLT